jgi:hypothetical protein
MSWRLGNRFAVLIPSEDTSEPILEPRCYFLDDLPRELRDQIYFDVISNAKQLSRSLAVKKHLQDHTHLNPRKHKVKGAFSLLYVNRQTCKEFFDALERELPLQVNLRLRSNIGPNPSMPGGDEGTYFEMSESYYLSALPTNCARRVAVRVSHDAVGISWDGKIVRDTSSLDTAIVISDEFQAFIEQLRSGSHATTIAIDYGTGGPHEGILINSLVQVVESFPQLLRYEVTIGWEGMYARREKTSVDWLDPSVVRFTGSLMPDGPAFD